MSSGLVRLSAMRAGMGLETRTTAGVGDDSMQGETFTEEDEGRVTKPRHSFDRRNP
ncbi:hypothetical protein FACS1894158_07990 [Betaproteobacteria bacterium]|nr:hypothetical protein FACS1894158_07990 [Betaproteobacteria bacterium]